MGEEQSENKVRRETEADKRFLCEPQPSVQIRTRTPSRSWDDLWARMLGDVAARLAGAACDAELEGPAEPRADGTVRGKMERG